MAGLYNQPGWVTFNQQSEMSVGISHAEGPANAKKLRQGHGWTCPILLQNSVNEMGWMVGMW